MKTISEQIGETLANEKGMPGIGVSIKRKYNDSTHQQPEKTMHQCTVGEFLSHPENQCGTWCIDGGWGGPPGPIHVRWNERTQEWENGGFCGARFET